MHIYVSPVEVPIWICFISLTQRSRHIMFAMACYYNLKELFLLFALLNCCQDQVRPDEPN